MPLHLLGKKSWNVYNQDNIARVRRDEAEARLREEEEERRVQQAEAEARLNQLRGIRQGQNDQQPTPCSRQYDEQPRIRKRRRLVGEDDTDREIRVAQEESASGLALMKPAFKKPGDVQLVDNNGHINLFSQDGDRKPQANEEATADAVKKQREYEDQYTMRFSNATGMKPGSDKPWYAATESRGSSEMAPVGKDVWGNEDPRRVVREKRRTDANDPLSSMKRGIKQLQQAEKRRQDWRAEREKDLNEVEELAKRRKRRRNRNDSDNDSLDAFNLDKGYEKSRPSSEHRSKRHSELHNDGSRRHCHRRRRCNS